MNKAILVVSFAVICACGQDLEERTIHSPSNALVDNWQSTGQVLDPTPSSGARFGQSVSTSNNWLAVTRQGTSSNSGITDLFQNTSSGWTLWFTQQTIGGPRPVAVLSPNWLVIGQPCAAPGTGCSGFIVAFWWNGSTWQRGVTMGGGIASWDFGSSLALRDLSGSGATAVSRLAVGGGGVVQVINLVTQVSAVSFGPVLREPTTPYQSTGFGSAIAMTSDGVAVAAPTGQRALSGFKGALTGFSPGYVYDFNLTTNTSTRLTGVGMEGANAPGFGASLAASSDGRTLAVGAASEVGRSLTAYVFKPGTTGAWNLSNTILAPKGAAGLDISVAIDGDLAVMTDASAGGLLRIYQQLALPSGATLSTSLNFGEAHAPMEMRNSRLVFGQPDSATTGHVETYALFAPVIGVSP